jgi:DNA-binding NtrC family response regulator
MAFPRILIVDDEPDILDVCARTLRRNGFQVITASDAQTARILMQAEAIDLLITDIRMPGESGISLLQSVHELAPTLPLMIITGYPDTPAVDAALDLNVKSFIVKPFDLPDFVSEVRRSLKIKTADTAAPEGSLLRKAIPIILNELRQHKVPILEGEIQHDPVDGQVVLVPEVGGAVPIDDFLTSYTQGKKIYLIVLPHP